MSHAFVRWSRRSLPFFLLGAAALGLAAANAPTSQEPGKHEEHAGGDEALEHAMEAMNGSLKALLKGVDANNKDKALEHVAKLQTNVLIAKLATPPMAEKLDAAKRPAFLAGYRHKLVDVLAASCKLEAAILDGKFDEANKVAKEELTRLKKEGHDEYQEEEEH